MPLTRAGEEMTLKESYFQGSKESDRFQRAQKPKDGRIAVEVLLTHGAVYRCFPQSLEACMRISISTLLCRSRCDVIESVKWEIAFDGAMGTR